MQNYFPYNFLLPLYKRSSNKSILFHKKSIAKSDIPLAFFQSKPPVEPDWPFNAIVLAEP